MDPSIITPATAATTTTADAIGESQTTAMEAAKGVAVIALAAYGMFTLGHQVYDKLRSNKDDESETKTDE